MLMRKIAEIIKRGLVVVGHPFIAPFIPDKYRPYSFVGGKIYLNINHHYNM